MYKRQVYCTKNSSEVIHKSVASFISKEKKFGIHDIKTLYEFNENVNFKKEKSLQKIANFKNNKEFLIGYGAPAKATTLLNFYNITSKDINFVIDDNPLKSKKFIPGTGIQILNRDSVAEKRVYKIIVLAWNFYDSIVNKNKSIYSKSTFDRLN